MQLEIWEKVKDASHYEVSNFGRVRSVSVVKTRSDGAKRYYEGKVLKSVISKNGYEQVSVIRRGKSKKEYVHRLVAEVFCGSSEGKPHVNHIDGNKRNNRFYNLEWCTQKENNRHAFSIGLNVGLYDPNVREVALEKTRKPILMLSLITGEILKEFKSISDAKRQTGISSIGDCLRGRQGTAGGYMWAYREAQAA